MSHIPDDLRQCRSFKHQLLVLLDGAGTERAAHLRDTQGVAGQDVVT